MSEGKKGKPGWVKAMLGGMAGLFSGACLAYLAPLVDKVVKPAAPLANFDTRKDGLSVTFQNLSTGPRGVEGWWDFGDGAPLRPIAADEEFVTHAYERPGDYNVKLMLRNALGDTNERGITLHLEPGGAAEPPKVRSLDVASLAPEAYAPATFRVAADVAGAQFCVWDLDEGRPLEVNADPPAGRTERLVTFSRPGGYVIKLAALRGEQLDQKSATVKVLAPPTGSLTAVLRVTDKATRVDRVEREFVLAAGARPDEASPTCPIHCSAQARSRFKIVDVRVKYPKGTSAGLQGKSAQPVDAKALGLPNAHRLLLERDADGQKVHLKGELTCDHSKKTVAGANVPVVLVEERQAPASRTVPVMASLMAPGSAKLMLPSLPPNWIAPSRSFRFELRDGDRVLWQGPDLPRGAAVTLGRKRCVLTATTAGDRVDVKLSDPSSGPVLGAN